MGRNISQFAGGQVSSLVINNTQPLTDNLVLYFLWVCILSYVDTAKKNVWKYIQMLRIYE